MGEEDREICILVLPDTGEGEFCGPPRGEGVSALVHTGPAALFFQSDGNAFFQFRDNEGRVRWVLMRGTNPFEEIRRRREATTALEVRRQSEATTAL